MDGVNTRLKQQFEQQGFVKLPGLFSPEEIDSLHDEIRRAAGRLEGEDQLNRGKLLFHSNLFRQSSLLRERLMDERLLGPLRAVGGPNLWVRWDQCISKTPGGAAFPWHQDNAYNRLLDQHFQLWIGITDQTRENGGLWLQPGSHRLGLLPHRQDDNHKVCEVEASEETFVGASKGDVIIFSSKILHHTKRNNSEEPRIAYVTEFMPLECYDPFVEGPYFVALQDGSPVGEWRSTYAGRHSLRSRLRYLPVQLSCMTQDLPHDAIQWVKRQIPRAGQVVRASLRR